jgi:hypothetical protein
MPLTRPPGWFDNPWVVFLLPLVVYLVVGSFEPPPPAQDGAEPAAAWFDLGVRYEHYPWIYGAKILLTAGAVVAVARGYPPRRAIHPLAIVVGVVGLVAWVALAHFQRWLVAALDIEQVTSWLGGHRPASTRSNNWDKRRRAICFWLCVSLAWPRWCRSSRRCSCAGF